MLENGRYPEERRAETKAIRDKRMETNMNAWREETEVNPEKMETNPDMMQSIGEHREVPKEGVAVKSSGTVNIQHRGPKQTAGRSGKPNELTRGDGGYRRKLAAACRKGPVVQQWHGAREKFSGKFGPREIMDRKRIGRSRREDEPTIQKYCN
jgi:hypothetical protein